MPSPPRSRPLLALAAGRPRVDLRLPFLVAFLLLGLTLAVTARADDAAPGRLERCPRPLAVLPEQAPVRVKTLGAGPSFEDQVMELVNVERLANGGLAPLRRNDSLEAAAELHSTNMAVRNFFSHCDPDTGTLPVDRVLAAGYGSTFVGENAAAGSATPVDVMALWMGSAGHRANILNTSYRELGIGFFFQSGDQANVRYDLDSNCVIESTGHGPFGNYWTQNFGRVTSVFPVVINREAYETASANVALYLYGSGSFSQMRIRNEAGLFTPWMPFATNVAWQLSLSAGVKTVEVELGNGGGPLSSAVDTIVLTGVFDQVFSDGFESGDISSWTSTGS